MAELRNLGDTGRRAVEGGINFFDTADVYNGGQSEIVREVAAARGVPSAQMALAWLLHRPGVTAPFVGATKLEQLADALAAERLSLSEEERARLEELYVPHAIAGHE